MQSWGATEAVVLAVALSVATALFVRVVKREGDPFIAKVIVLGLIAKLAGSVARFTFMAELYDGVGDFNRYFRNGIELAGVIRSGSIPDQARSTGTPFMDFIAGVTYAVLPNRLWVGFAFFAMLAFVGALLFLKAFQLAVPDGHHRRFALLVFFLPTMVFWPSNLGKEAWLVFTLGITTYGAARVMRRAPFGLAIAALGGAGVFLVRPHMGALFAIAFAGALLLRFRDPDVKDNAIAGVVGLLIVGLAASYAASRFGEEMPRDESVEGSATDQVFAEANRRTSKGGGSTFESRPVRSPADLAHAIVTVPFRPFPTEAHNRQAQLASLEGVFLLLLFAFSLPRLATLRTALLRRPFIALAAAYSLGFVIAFSNVANFGLLVRQRAQLVPFLLVLLCLPLSNRRQAPVNAVQPAPPPQGIVASRGQPVLIVTQLPRSAIEPASSTRSPTPRPPTPPVQPPGPPSTA